MRAFIAPACALALGACAIVGASEPNPNLTPKAAAALEAARKLEGSRHVTASGLKAVKDRATGQLRAPTAEEDAELSAGALPKRVTTVRANADGSLSARLGDEHLSDVVAVKDADGTVTMACLPHEHSDPVVSGATPIANANGIETE